LRLEYTDLSPHARHVHLQWRTVYGSTRRSRIAESTPSAGQIRSKKGPCLLHCMSPELARSRGVPRCNKWSGIGNAADPRRPLAGPPPLQYPDAARAQTWSTGCWSRRSARAPSPFSDRRCPGAACPAPAKRHSRALIVLGGSSDREQCCRGISQGIFQRSESFRCWSRRWRLP
jgi:hypothetical protein